MVTSCAGCPVYVKTFTSVHSGIAGARPDAGRQTVGGIEAPNEPGGSVRIYLSCDMEGVAGISDWSQCRPGGEG
jgi:hypothetical protein